MKPSISSSRAARDGRVTRRRYPHTLLGLAALLTAAPAVAAPERDCYAATDAIAARRWADAEALLAARVDAPACAAHAESLRFSLAYVIEQQATTDARRACDARRRYAALLDGGVGDAQIAEAARAGAGRMTALCAEPAHARTDDPAPPESDPSADDGTWIALAVAAGVAVAGGSVSLWFATEADDRRAAAESDLRRFHAAGDRTGFAEAERAFESAADEATALGITGWGAIGLGALLAGGAAWLALDGPVSVAVSPTGFAIGGGF